MTRKNLVITILMLSIFMLQQAHSQVQSPILLQDQPTSLQVSLRELLLNASVQSAGRGASCEGLSVDISDLVQLHLLKVVTPNLKSVRSSRLERSLCTVAIGFQLPAGKKIVIADQGEIISLKSSSDQSRVRLNSEIFLAGSQSRPLRKEIKGKMQDTIIVPKIGKILASDCGSSVILRLNKSMATNNSLAVASETLMQLDLVDCSER